MSTAIGMVGSVFLEAFLGWPKNLGGSVYCPTENGGGKAVATVVSA